MDDEFTLVSKDKLESLREENKELKEKNSDNVSKEVLRNRKEDSDFINKIILTISNESKKERDLIIQELSEIKELNRTTLNNVLHRTDKLDTRISEMIETLSDLTKSLSDLIDDLLIKNREFGNSIEMKHLLKELNTRTSKIELNSNSRELIMKIEEIEIFMSNLKMLLSQIKPNDMRM